MIDPSDKLYKDFEAVRNIPIIGMMLEVICGSTGNGPYSSGYLMLHFLLSVKWEI